MRFLRAGFLVRRMRSAWLLLTCLTASVLITSVLISAMITFYSTALPAAVRKNLIASGQMSLVVNGGANSSQHASSDQCGRCLGAPCPGRRAYRAYHVIWSDDLNLPGGLVAGTCPRTTRWSRPLPWTRSRDSQRLVSGTWPAAPAAGQPIPVALPAVAADQLKLRIGAVVKLTDRATGKTVRMRVAGLFRRRTPASLYWAVDPLGSAGMSDQGGFLSYGPAVVSAAAFGPGGGLSPNLLSVVALPSATALRHGDLVGLAQPARRGSRQHREFRRRYPA